MTSRLFRRHAPDRIRSGRRALTLRQADLRRVQEWMGHAAIQTTMKYLHYESRKEDADLVPRASSTERVEEARAAGASE